MNITGLKRQHIEILDLLKKIEGKLDYHTIAEHAFDITLNIGLLSGKIITHLSSEDKFLYPDLINHPEDRVRSISKTFMSEMGGLAKTFTLYKTKYMNTNNIKSNPQQFITDTRTVFSAIARRIQAEEKSLYPLIS